VKKNNVVKKIGSNGGGVIQISKQWPVWSTYQDDDIRINSGER
jgi:hypothetical protein